MARALLYSHTGGENGSCAPSHLLAVFEMIIAELETLWAEDMQLFGCLLDSCHGISYDITTSTCADCSDRGGGG